MSGIDIHTHGIGGYDTRAANPEDILKIAAIHGSFGVTEIIPTIYSAPIHVMRKNMTAVKGAMELQKIASSVERGAERHSSGCADDQPVTSNANSQGLISLTLKAQHSTLPSLILGVHLEGPFLNPSLCGALDPSSFLKPDKRAFIELIDGLEDIIRIITIAPELGGALDIIKNARDTGINMSMGHSDATFAEAEAGYQKGAQGITHLFNAMRGLHHREPGIAGFGLLNKDVYAEVIADPYHLHPDVLKLIFRTKNPDKIIIISDTTKDSYGIARENTEVRRQGSRARRQKLRIHNPEFIINPPPRTGILRGGSSTIIESSNRLIKMGYNEKIIMDCIDKNPASYLRAVS
jgi:N-acetylglucosamine-6-phosphate deacetylase